MNNKFSSVEEMKEKLKSKRSFLWYLESWWHVYFWNWVTDLKWKIPHWFSRAKRGWSFADVWSFDCYLSKVIYEGLEHLKNIKTGYPSELCFKYEQMIELSDSEKERLAIDEWNNILDDMIVGFRLINQIGNGEKLYLSSPKPQICECYISKEEEQKIERAWQLFKEYFHCLWD